MQLFYRKYGKGKPVIILHGLFGMSDNWVTFGKELSGKYEVFIPDQRNHGRSPHSDGFDYNILKDDIIEFMEQNKLKDVILIGHSMGGKVAMHIAINNPELISKLIVLDISPASKSPAPEIIQVINAIRKINLGLFAGRKEIKNRLSEVIERRKVVDFLLKNVQSTRNRQFKWKFNSEAISNSLTHIASGIETDKKFQKPILFIGGDKSPYISGENIYQIFEIFPGAKVEVMKNAGHWIHVDAYEELIAMVKDFLVN